MQHVEQLRVDRVDLVGAVIAQYPVDVRQGFCQVFAAGPIGPCEPLTGVQVVQAQCPLAMSIQSGVRRGDQQTGGEPARDLQEAATGQQPGRA